MDQDFKVWLIKKGFAINTAGDYSFFIEKKFLPYLNTSDNNQACSFFSIDSIEEKETIGPIVGPVDHETLMQYIRYRKGQGIGPKTINM